MCGYDVSPRPAGRGPIAALCGSLLEFSPSVSANDVAFLRQTGLFKGMSDDHLATLAKDGEVIACGPGHVVVQQGSKGGDLFVVKSGVLEARDESQLTGRSTLVGYVFPGECVGEMSILTGSPRSVTVRVPESAEIFRVPGAVFDRVLHSDVEVAVAVARGLAARLERANRHTPAPPAENEQRHLAGDLKYFDVPEVCQTLVQARRTGQMTLTTVALDGDVSVCFQDGDIKHARVGTLRGAEAVLYLLRTKLSGRFEFRASDVYPGPKDEKPIKASAMALLLEAAQQRDEMEALLRDLPPMTHTFQVVALAFPFDGPLATPVDPDDVDPGELMNGNWQPATEVEREFARSMWSALVAKKVFGKMLDERLGKEPLALQIFHALKVKTAIR